jgi:hypothetical protein
MPSIDGATGWLNSPPLTSDCLRGKVVAVDFCTYTCINWIRTLPYRRAWADTYTDQGLVVLGVHTPEFSFEKDVVNVRRALEQMQVRWPIALDSNYAVWDAFANRYWPALYLVDAAGRIQYHWFGEGDYERSEIMIRRLLVDVGVEDLDGEVVQQEIRGAEAEANWDELRSPETYLGSRRTERFGSPGGIRPARPDVYDVPDRLPLNEWALSGSWTIQEEHAASNEPGGRIAFEFHARDLHLVMAPVAGTDRVPFRVRLDGEPPLDAHGEDIDEDGRGVTTDPRMYQLIRQSSPIVDRRFEIEFLDAGVAAYVCTFG